MAETIGSQPVTSQPSSQTLRERIVLLLRTLARMPMFDASGDLQPTCPVCLADFSSRHNHIVDCELEALLAALAAQEASPQPDLARLLNRLSNKCMMLTFDQTENCIERGDTQLCLVCEAQQTIRSLSYLAACRQEQPSK